MYEIIPKKNIARIAIVMTDCKMTLHQVVAKHKPSYVINGGLYDMKTGEICDIPLRVDGKTLATSDEYGYYIMEWNEGSDIHMGDSSNLDNCKNAIACSSILKDGEYTYLTAANATRGRTALGTDDSNVHLFVTIDKDGALTPKQLRKKMKDKKCKDAIMMDCGGSSQGYFNGVYVQGEKRKVANWVLIWLKEDANKDSGSKTPSVCPFKAPTSNVKRGSRGEGVKWVQWHLNASMGLDLVVDGIFGSGTNSAVLKFQKKYGLAADGIVGKMTREKLKEAVR